MKWLDRVPLPVFTVFAMLLALAPFLPEPHLAQKLRLMRQGGLAQPLDIFDLLLHGVPLALLALKVLRQALRGSH